jgi:putative phosphoesterase
MIAGFLSDAHGNPYGLESCLRAVQRRGAERVFFLGDAVGYFPEETAVLDLLRSSGTVCVRGNHEGLLLGDLPLSEARDRVYRLTEAKSRLSAAHRAWLVEWPERLEVNLAGRRGLLVHGNPAEPLTGYVYPDTDVTRFGELPFDLVVMGHTHRPFFTDVGGVTILNPGSCGMPRDVGYLASCAIYDSVTGRCEILRTALDVESLLARWESHIDPSAAACLRRRSPADSPGMELA